ncbi:MAG: hypothetical protein B7Y25_00640 [Alphaproteobacteria bacterium 16-39-46]|nr:MAG: hypothetical protein B7Y25_00640 [Alphaproteobacteria bacterium 16-39-46]OZA44347.1 MAG: hypothetical protein B7X84_00645 [Alphaproteobacteria bacterium 17-39-52]HQS83417.1 hypothetical protein [Alphaproteobacteria bacterium]HQS93181.1 hypothetical protein [Alphaproteobacteria bacterium]
MSFKKIIVCSFFLLFWHTAFSMMDPDQSSNATESQIQRVRRELVERLNHQTGKLYSANYIFSEDLRRDPSSPSMTQSIFYTLEGIQQNGVPLTKTTDEAGNTFWKPRDREDFFISEASLLRNFTGLDFLNPRKHPISQEQFSILKNPNFYLEQHENSFFQHDPFSLKVKSTLSSPAQEICAVQTGCFLRGHAPSLKAYEDLPRFPQKRFSFRTTLTSEKLGFLEVDILGMFNTHVGYQLSLNVPENEENFEPNMIYLTPEKTTLSYAVKGPSGKIERKTINKKNLPFPYKKSSRKEHFDVYLSEILKITSREKHTHHIIFTPRKYVYALNSEDQLDVFVLTDLPPPFGEQLIKIEASQTLSFKTEDDPSEYGDGDWEMIDQEEEQSAATSSSLPGVPSIPPSFSFTKTKEEIPGLIYFCHHRTSEDAFKQEEALFHATLSTLRQRASLLEEGLEKHQLLQEIKQKVSEYVLQKNTRQAFHVEFNPMMPPLVLQGSLRKGEKVTYSINSEWKELWGIQEQGPEQHDFQIFLERCLDRCSQKAHLNAPFTSPTRLPIFERGIPPEGYYLETKGEEGQFLWKALSQTGEASSHTFFPVTYKFNLCFGTFPSEQTPDEDALNDRERQRLETFEELPTNVSSLIINNMVFSSQAEASLLKILETSLHLSSVTLTGCTFNAGFLPRLMTALNTKNITHVDLTQSYFRDDVSDDQRPPVDFKTTLENFITHHRTLTALTFSGTLGLSQKILKKEGRLSFTSFYGDRLEINSHNLPFLKKLMRENLLSSLKKLTFQDIFFSESEQDALTPQTMTPLDFIGLLSGLIIESPHLDHLCITNCFGKGLPPEFFNFVTGKTFHTLDLSGTPLLPLEGGFPCLTSLNSKYPLLTTLILRGCFKQENPLNCNLVFSELKFVPLKTLDLSCNVLSSETDPASFKLLPSSLEDLNLSGIFQTLPLDIIAEALRALPNLKHFYITVASHPKETYELQRRYASFIKTMKAVSPSALYVGEENPPENPHYHRIFLNLTGEENEKIIVTPLNLSLLLDSRPLDPGYRLNFYSSDTDFKRLTLEPKNLYLKAFRGEILYAVVDPSGKFAEDKIPFETVRLNFSGDLLTQAAVESSLHHIFRTLLHNHHLPSPRSVEFQRMDPDVIENVCSCVQSKLPTITHLGFVRSFQIRRSFEFVCRFLNGLSLNDLQHIDFSENDFESLFNSERNSYAQFKWFLLSLFQSKPSLQKIIFTEKDKNRIEWIKVGASSGKSSIPEIQTFELPTAADKPYRLFINPASAPENTKMFSGESIYFFGSIENYVFNHIIIQDAVLDATTIPPVLNGLKSTRFNKSLTLSRCFEGMGKRSLLSFFTEISKLPLQSLHIEHVFDRDTFHALAAVLSTSPFLRELSIELPNRDNHKLIRTIIGGTLGSGAAVAAVFFSGGTAAVGLPLIAGITGASGATAGAVGGFSGSVADRIKAAWDVPSRQVYEALLHFAKSPNLAHVNAGNYTRSDESHASMKRLLEKDTGNRIQFRFFSPV